MEPFTRLTGVAAPLFMPNIDTDVIMPKTFLKGIDRQGLAAGVFNLLRFEGGRPRPDFILNQPGFEETRFLVVGANFGCGSSREHAVWGLRQIGIRALIGPGFAGLFEDNCRNNGLLTITLPLADAGRLAAGLVPPAGHRLTIDLEQQTIRHEGRDEVLSFTIEPARKAALLAGHDAIAGSLARAAAIRAFEAAHRAANPWYF